MICGKNAPAPSARGHVLDKAAAQRLLRRFKRQDNATGGAANATTPPAASEASGAATEAEPTAGETPSDVTTKAPDSGPTEEVSVFLQLLA